MDTIHFLGEEDFRSAMDHENKTWRDNCVTKGSITSFDGTRLNYYIADPQGITEQNSEYPDPTVSITIVHGLGEFFAKYYEYVWYLNQAGCKVFFLEQRGHGYSEGKIPEPDLVYIDDYATYVEDLNIFTNQIVIPQSKSMPRLVLAHSMGGAVTTRFLEMHPEVFQAAILSSPMLKMKAGNINRFVETILRIYVALFGLNKKLAFNQKRFNPDPVFEISSARSRARFDYQLKFRREDEHYQTTGVTFGWALASIKVHRDIFKDIDKIRIPIDLFTAGQDHLIDPAGYELFAQKVNDLRIHPYENSRHEIFNSDDNDREKYFSEVIKIINGYQPPLFLSF